MNNDAFTSSLLAEADKHVVPAVRGQGRIPEFQGDSKEASDTVVDRWIEKLGVDLKHRDDNNVTVFYGGSDKILPTFVVLSFEGAFVSGYGQWFIG